MRNHRRRLLAGCLTALTLVGTTLVGTAVVGTTSAAAAAACRDVEHEAGTTCVPKQPKRIVALDPLTVLPTLLDVGAPVVGSMDVFAGKRFPSYLDKDKVAKKTAPVGQALVADLEAIAAARPDLIIATTQSVGDNYDKLSALAPTVVVPWGYYDHDWESVVRQIAGLVGKTKAVDKQINALHKREAALKQRIAAQGTPPTLSRVDVYQGMPLYYRWKCLWFGDVLEQVGITQPSAQDEACETGNARSAVGFVSDEEIAKLDGDVIYAYQQQSGDDAGANPVDALAKNPLWSTLGAVKAGDVEVVGDAWGLGAGVRAANLVLDDLESLAEPSPSTTSKK